MKITSIILFLLLSMLAACVGTVQEATSPNGLQVINPPTYFIFPGITTARPISHNKVELEFFPAAGGTNIVYKIYINDNANPSIVDPQSLLSAPGGKLLLTVKDLLADTEYKFKLVAADTVLNKQSKDENEAFAKTYDNRVANFDGISKVALVPGATDRAIRVSWITPPMDGFLSAGPYDPVKYEITLISQIGGLANINNINYGGTDRKQSFAPDGLADPMNNPSFTQIEGLTPNTTYYVQVRAQNQLWRSYFDDHTVTSIPVSREMNTKYMTIKTAAGGSLFDFRQDNVIVTNAPSLDAFDKIDVYWQPGSGSFFNYRVFARKYEATGDPYSDDLLSEAMLNNMNVNGPRKEVAATDTSTRISGLDNGGVYQVKVALCKTVSCPVIGTDPDAAIISELKVIKVQPTLAPFSGINAIEPPGQFGYNDVVNLRFDAPIVTSGYANQLEIYCVNPIDHAQQVKFNGTTPISGSAISQCNGLYLDGITSNIATYTNQKVRGIVANGTVQYCFSATPAIIGYGTDIRMAAEPRIERCSYPEVVPPTNAQFPGLKNTCTISANTARIEWPLPTGGVYSSFQVFWKESSTQNKFNFTNGIHNQAGYAKSLDLTADTLEYLIEGLIPGKTYQVGVLAKVDMSPSPALYSELNLNIVDCTIPLPEATFKGFNRIFAIGPKVDGRYPNAQATGLPPADASIFEAIDSSGIPFEIPMDGVVASTTDNYTAPPGRDFGLSFSAKFDGASNGSGHAMSREGVISLAWEDVSLSYNEAQTLFITNQPLAAQPRTGRVWGYRVLRSNDNQFSWKDVTPENGSGLIYSMPYSYTNRPGLTPVAKRIAFFTDYSVKALSEVHDATNARDIERARTYFYKIVPMFNGKALSYTPGLNHHIVKVTLPPPNMALVHRWMANRAHCLEYDKTINLTNNYSCDYNGLGARPKGIPHQVGQTSLDQGGDVLVDRYELGCRYTRGARDASPDTSASHFDLGNFLRPSTNDFTYYPGFKGFRTIDTLVDTTAFMGCTGKDSSSVRNNNAYPADFVADYQHFLQGDCMGPHGANLAVDACSAQNYLENKVTFIKMLTPGLNVDSVVDRPDCSDSTPSDPKTMTSRLTGNYAPNLVMQSEFLAVFYNTYSPGLNSGTGYNAPIEGPATTSITASRNLSTNWGTGSGNSASQCSINLAAIDGSGYMKPRWLTVNDFNEGSVRFKGNNSGLSVSMTVDQISEIKTGTAEPLTLYNGEGTDGTAAAWRLPQQSPLRTSPRYKGTTRIGKVFASNSAKLPPLGRLNPKTAYKLCTNHWVQIGSATDNGNFAPSSLPQQKRPLRRKESVIAAAWPDTYTTSTIDSLENSANLGSCNTAARNISGINTAKGKLLGNHIPYYSSDMTKIPVVTGSAAYNMQKTYLAGNHTNRCISRFGVQDLPGNIAESNSERLFCDYTKDKSFMGPVTGAWGVTDIANRGLNDVRFEFFNTTNERNYGAVLASGAPTGATGPNAGTFTINFSSGDDSIIDAKPFVNVSTDSGYCSFVDSIPENRSDEDVNNFRDANGFWNPLFLPGGVLNTAMISRQQTDQDAVLDWRNGDGRFYDLGPLGMGAALNYANTLSLSAAGIIATDKILTSKYFNPVLGIPLKCQGTSCTDPIFGEGNDIDNTKITTATFYPNIKTEENDVTPAINDFYIGSSQITHLGISEFEYEQQPPGSGVYRLDVPQAGQTSPSNFSEIITSVTYDSPATMNLESVVRKTFPTDWTAGDVVEFYKVVWDVERDSEFGLVSGGKTSDLGVGRYSASLSRNYNYAGTNTSDMTSGVRCSILINQDE